MSPAIAEHVPSIKENILDAVANDPQWYEPPTMHVTDYGKRGDYWTVEITGIVDVQQIQQDKLKAKAEQVSSNGFAVCTETYIVLIEGTDIESLNNTNVVYKAMP